MSKTAKQRRREDVPNTDHVARYCNPQRVIRDPNTHAITGVFPQAFALRPEIKESYLSTHWMESFAVEVDAQFQSVVAALRDKFVKVRPKAAVARLNVGCVVQEGAMRELSIRIRDRSNQNNPGYSGIYGMPRDNSDIEFLALLANECCIEVRGVDEVS
jgi:hypothetical protein